MFKNESGSWCLIFKAWFVDHETTTNMPQTSVQNQRQNIRSKWTSTCPHAIHGIILLELYESKIWPPNSG